MVTARNIFSADGQMLLSSDTSVTESYVRRLHELGVYAIYVHNPFFEDVEIPVVISEDTRIASVQTVKRGFEVLRNKRSDLDLDDIQQAARRIVTEILRNRQALIHLTEIRTHDDYTFAHSVDVCTLAVLVAVQLGYAENRLHELAIGSLLHDIGKIRIDEELLKKPTRLNDDEMAVMRAHTLFGFEILRNQKGELSFPSIHIALQHHEKYDGTGYPRGLKRDEIHEFSRIVSVVDVYDAITSDRPYRKALLPHEAHELMVVSANQHFDPKLLTIFLDKIAVYPVGTVVRLTTGDIGVVIFVAPDMQARPTVRLIMDKHRRLYPGVTKLDMRNHLTIFVDQVVDGKKLFNLI